MAEGFCSWDRVKTPEMRTTRVPGVPRTPTEASGGDLGPSRAERTPDPQAPRESLFVPLWGLWMWELR